MNKIIEQFIKDVKSKANEKLAATAAEISGRNYNINNPPEAGGGGSGLSVDFRSLLGSRSNYNTGYSGYQNTQVSTTQPYSNYSTGYPGYNTPVNKPPVTSFSRASIQVPANSSANQPVSSTGSEFTSQLFQPQLLLNNQELQDSMPSELAPYSNPDAAKVIPAYKTAR